jgi:glucose/arabinose dehydrogenase
MRHRSTIVAAALAGAALASATRADEPALASVRVASGLHRPIFATAPPGDFDRLFILEQHTGRIRILDLATRELRGRPFLEMTGLPTGLEDGLVSLAFDPQYATSGRFYLTFVTGAGHVVHLARGTVSADPDVAEDRLETLLALAHPVGYHHGASLAFGPDGLLYMTVGDGGPQGDPGDRAQDLSVIDGKVLRLDVSGAAGYSIPPDNPYAGATGVRHEIWASGLRNPWRLSFDRATGDMWIGDVGYDAREEIDFEAAGGAGGTNFGWRCREGTLAHAASTTIPCGSCDHPACPLTPPIHEYGHSTGRCVIGGYVYRGCAVPALRGAYFFADYANGRVWSLRRGADGGAVVTEHTDELVPAEGSIDKVSSFGEDGRGELYVLDRAQGELFRIVPAAPPAGDLDGDGDTDLADLGLLLSAWGACPAPCGADLDGDGLVDFRDLMRLFEGWTTCP